MAMQPPYPQAPQQAPQKKGMSTCLIVAIVVGVLGALMSVILVPLAIYGVRRYLASSKTAEAKMTVGAMTRAAVAAYEREGAAGPAHQLCKSSARVPAAPPPAKKYQPNTADGTDFHAGDETTGWKCLRFSINEPIYYAYKYDKGAGSGKSGATPNGFEASALGDLDGNGVNSFFARGADVRSGSVVVSTELYIENEFE
jgi:type IV pilus assembly protein PilA